MNQFPPCTERNVYYARVSKRDGRESLWGFFTFVSSIWVDADQATIVRAHVRERDDTDPPSNYWAWEPVDEPGKLLMIQPSVLFGIQFAYGVEAEERAGRGRRVNVVVEVLERFEPR